MLVKSKMSRFSNNIKAEKNGNDRLVAKNYTGIKMLQFFFNLELHDV